MTHDLEHSLTGYSKLTLHPMQTVQTANRTGSPDKQYKSAAPEWLSSEDRQLKRTFFNEIQALSGHEFTLDAAATANGSNAMLLSFAVPETPT